MPILDGAWLPFICMHLLALFTQHIGYLIQCNDLGLRLHFCVSKKKYILDPPTWNYGWPIGRFTAICQVGRFKANVVHLCTNLLSEICRPTIYIMIFFLDPIYYFINTSISILILSDTCHHLSKKVSAKINPKPVKIYNNFSFLHSKSLCRKICQNFKFEHVTIAIYIIWNRRSLRSYRDSRS